MFRDLRGQREGCGHLHILPLFTWEEEAGSCSAFYDLHGSTGQTDVTQDTGGHSQPHFNILESRNATRINDSALLSRGGEEAYTPHTMVLLIE